MVEASRRLGRGELSIPALVEEARGRAASGNGQAQLFSELRDRSVLVEMAHDAEHDIHMGRYLGPLHGMPIAVAENFAVVSPLQPVPDWAIDGPLGCLTGAGAIVMGTTRVLWPVDRKGRGGHPVSGWLEGGHEPAAATVAAGWTMAVLATDTAGQVREAAGKHGVIGLKPTFGRISGIGANLVAWSLDHPAILAGSVEDAALVLNTLSSADVGDGSAAGREESDLSAVLSHPVAGWRIGVPPAHVIDRHHPDVHRAYSSALEILKGLGAVVVEVSLPASFEPAIAAHALIGAIENSAYFLPEWNMEDLAAPEGRPRAVARAMVERGTYRAARQIRSALIRELGTLFEGIDVLATPAQEVVSGGLASGALEFRCQFNLCGFPALVVPCPTAGSPVGIQLVAPPFEEVTALVVGHALRVGVD